MEPSTVEIPDIQISPNSQSKEGQIYSKHVLVVSNMQALPNVQIESLISQAIEKNVPIETMERLLAMARDIKADYAKEAFDTALSNFQSECPIIAKTKAIRSKDGQLYYKYAPLEDIVTQVKSLLQKYGFSYSIQTATYDDSVSVTCHAKHNLGHLESSSIKVPLGTKTNVMSNTQQVAAAITFAKRYAFCNAFGILTGDQDTDSKQGVSYNEAIPQSKVSLSTVLTAFKIESLDELSTPEMLGLLKKLLK